MGTVDEKQPIGTDNSSNKGSSGSASKKKKKKNSSKRDEENCKNLIANGSDKHQLENIEKESPLAEGAINKVGVKKEKKRKMKQDSNEDTVPKKSKVDSDAGIMDETVQKKDDKDENSNSKSTLDKKKKSAKGKKSEKVENTGSDDVMETISIDNDDENKDCTVKTPLTKEEKLFKRKKTENVSDNSEKCKDEPDMKKLKIESEKSCSELEIQKLEISEEVGNDTLISKKKNKKKTNKKCIGEPVSEKSKVENMDLSVELNTSDREQVGDESVTANKKKKKKKNKGKRIETISEELKASNGNSSSDSEMKKKEIIDKESVGDTVNGNRKKKKPNLKSNEELDVKEIEIGSDNASNGIEMKKSEISDNQQLSDNSATTKKMDKNANTVETSEVITQREELDSSVANSESQGKKKRKKKKKKNKKKVGMVGGEWTVTEIAKESSEKTKIPEKSSGSLEKVIAKKKNKKVKGVTLIPSSHGNISQSQSKGKEDEARKDSSDEIAVSVHAKLNDGYADGSKKDEIIKCWSGSSPLQDDNGCTLLTKPFKVMYMPKFLQDSHFLQKVKEELISLELQKKSNDLYKFSQTSDLKSVTSPYIASLRKLLYGDFRKWLSEVTGIELNDTVDMGSSRYEYTDVLLCHDDELEGRRVAYILYLTPPWYEKDGGTLDLFDVDNKGQPRDIVESLLPKWNTLAFFEVSPVSFHQVREVLSRDKVRLSINGWFHGPNIDRPPKHIPPPREFLLPVDLEEEELYAWINPTYLDADTQRDIRKKFQNDSEIELESFICQAKYEELSKAMQTNMKWVSTGPANKQSCKVLKQGKRPGIIEDCVKFLKSEALFLIMSQLTGLKLHRLAPPDSESDSDEEDEDAKDSSPRMIIDIKQWTHGCYTLLRDSDQAERNSALDASLFVGVSKNWTLEHGGFTSYIAKDEDEELLTVLPRSNCLALVYRDTETLKFTKYINASTKDLGNNDNTFYEFVCTYRE